jgi:hypothetical protein
MQLALLREWARNYDDPSNDDGFGEWDEDEDEDEDDGQE